MKALITDASYLHSLAIVRYLAKEKIEPYIIGNSKYKDIARFSKYCKGYFNFSEIKDEKNYINFIIQILEKNNIDILIPVSYKSTELAAKYKEEINKISRVEVADIDKIQLALNKKDTYQLAEKIDIPCPQTLYPKSIKEIETIAIQIKYPAVIKWIFEVVKNIVVIVNNKDDLIREYKNICKEYNPDNEFLPMIQEYIPANKNEVYCFSAIYQKGKCKNIFIQKQIRNVPVKGGTCACAVSCYIPEIINYGKKILDILEWHGVAHIEFKYDIYEKKYKLLEINPKFWASTDMSLAANVNFPYLLCQISKGAELKYSENYDKYLKFHFPFSKELMHLAEKPSSFFEFFIDLLNPKVKSNVWLSDLKPNLLELIISLSSIISNSKLKNIFNRLFK